MWQRIQTVFLAVAIVALLISLFIPIWLMTTGGEQHALYALSYRIATQNENGTEMVRNYMPYCITGVLIVASITLAFIEITKFKDRILQIKVGTLNALLLAGILISAVYFATSMVKTFEGGHYGFGLWLPGIAVVCNWLAMRFIRRDEKLVRDSDRLR